MWSCEIPRPDRFSSQVSGYTQGPKKAAQSNTSLGIADNKQYQCPPLGGWISSPPVVSAGGSHRDRLWWPKAKRTLCYDLPEGLGWQVDEGS